MSKVLDKKAIQARIRAMQSLQMIMRETEKLNKLLDEMHSSAISNQKQKAA